MKLREAAAENKFIHDLELEVLERVVSEEVIREVFEAQGVSTERRRKLSLESVVRLIIAMGVYAHVSIGSVVDKLFQAREWLGFDPAQTPPGNSAVTYRRYQLGVRPMAALFRRICRPLAVEETAGAFRFGLRLMAIDGDLFDVEDTPSNERVFGRHSSGRGEAAFPQVQCVYLCECGSHALIDAGIWPCHTSERVGGFRLLRSVEPGMLVMWDRGFHDYDMFRGTKRRGAHALGRLPAHVRPVKARTLEDGSSLAWLSPSDPKRRKRGERQLVRVIEYTLDDPQRPGYRERHRLVTTLLDAALAPALEIVCLYHERWEVELVIDEIDTHLRLTNRPLRSRKPVGVIQEIYGLLIAHYALRFLMYQAALQTGVDPDRLSFTHTLRVIQDAILVFPFASEKDRGRWERVLLERIARGRLPERRLRLQPRVVKRKMSKFPLKRAEHQRWPQLKTPFKQVVQLI
jgi:hypothetical protein